MTPDELYDLGYEDGKGGKASNASYVIDKHYSMGYEDGRGDFAAEKPVAEDFPEYNNPPDGFVFTGEKRTPEPGEYYLTKNGNAKLADKVRGNNQTRHILIPD